MRTSVLASVIVFAAVAQTPIIDQSLSMQSVADAQISPDARFVAYAIQQANWDDNEFVQQIWIAITATGERYQLTSGKKSSQSPKWSADSNRMTLTHYPPVSESHTVGRSRDLSRDLADFLREQGADTHADPAWRAVS